MLRFNRKKRKKFYIDLSFIKSKYVLFGLVAVCLCLMIFSLKIPGFAKPIANAVTAVVVPMQKGINYLGRDISKLFTEKDDIERLRLENEALKQRIYELEQSSARSNLEQYELDSLRGLYYLDKKFPEYDKKAATVIAREGNGWYSILTVDKGKNDGIDVGMNVIAGNGLVGIVTSVTSNSSVIRTIIDDTSSVSGMCLRTHDTCVVSGNLGTYSSSGMINVSMLALNSSVKENEELITSYISDKFHPGILIGYISDIQPDSSKMTNKAYLIPAVNFDHINDVFIITTPKQIYEIGD